MQRQRGELVPVGEVVADLDGPVKAIREASPQARHHFTRFDQVNAVHFGKEPPGTRRREAIGASQKRWFRFRDGLE